MDTNDVIQAFDSLAQETRLQAIRVLVEYGDTGMPAGQLSEALGVPQNTLSFHLKQLLQAGLVSSRREGRNIYYQAQTSTLTQLSQFLLENCCAKAGGTCGDI